MNTLSKTAKDLPKILVSGCLGRMGSEVAKTINAANDLVLVSGYDPNYKNDSVLINGEKVAPAFTDLAEAIEETKPQIMIEFTQPDVAANNLKTALNAGVKCVLGTSGVSRETLVGLVEAAPEGATLFYAPNFTTGAVLMMAASKLAAKYFEDIDIIEFHHNNKKDAPSGTAVSTAETLTQVRANAGVSSAAPGKETELAAFEGARGAELPDSDIHLHSVRSNGFVASQEVIFGSPGQTLTIRHDSFDRSSYMPGVLLAVRSIGTMSGLVIGLEELMDL